jgi:hypothetical protein
MILLVGALTDDGVDDGLHDVLLRHDALHVFDEVVSLVDLLMLEVVDHEVQTRLWDDFDKWRQNLESILTAAEHDEVVAEQVIVLEHVAGGGTILEDLEFIFRALSGEELEVIAGLEVDTDY